MSHTTRHLVSLQNSIDRYIDLIDGLKKNRDTFRDVIYKMTFSEPGLSQIVDLERLADSYRFMEVDKDSLLREIDRLSAIIAGNIAYLIEDCMENYSMRVKVWCRDEINGLASLQNQDSLSQLGIICFPIAVGILSPYLFKTKNLQNSERFAGVRNAIRNLIDT